MKNNAALKKHDIPVFTAKPPLRIVGHSQRETKGFSELLFKDAFCCDRATD